MMYGSWDMECGNQNFILGHFLLFCPVNNLQNQHFKKMKKVSGDIIILHRGNTNGSYIMYGSWNMEHSGHNFLSIWTNFCHFTPLHTWKIKNLKTWKNACRYHFTHVYHKWQSYDICFLRYGARQIFLSFWTIFCPFTHNNPNNSKSKFWKNENKNLEINLHKCTKNHYMLWYSCDRYGMRQIFIFRSFWAIFYPFTLKKSRLKKCNNTPGDIIVLQNVYQKLWSYDIWFLRYGAPRTYERIDKVIYRGGRHT